MKKVLITLMVILLVLAAVAYLAYPTFIRQAAGVRDDGIMQDYRRKASRMTTEEIQERLDKAEAYNETLQDVLPEDPFSGREVLTLHRYEAPLNTGDGLIGILTIPGISLKLPVYHESAERKATEKIVHIQGTSLPSDLPGNHIMLAGPGMLSAEGFAGKIGLSGERMLEDADQLTPGDLIILNVLDRTMVYQVEWIQTMAPEGIARADLSYGTEDEILTLVIQRKERRLLIRGKRISAGDAVEAVKDMDRVRLLPDWQSILFLGSPAILLGLIVILIVERIKKKSYRLPEGQAEPAEAAEQTERKGDESNEA